MANLKPTYVIFITENDVLGGGFPLYHIDRKISELNNKLFCDGSHIIYVNGAYTNESEPIGMLIHDFKCKSANEMHYPILADRARYFKETEGGQEHMCKLMEEYGKEVSIKSAVDTARRYGASESAILADIMEQFGLSESEAKDYLLKKSA